MAAFIINDDSILEDTTVVEEDPSLMPASFLAADDRHPFAIPKNPVPVAAAAARKNLLSMIDAEATTLHANAMLPAPEDKETVRVFLRIKPRTLEESALTQEDAAATEDMVKIESAYQVALTAPKESHTYKNSMNGGGKLTHRYSFTQIFAPQTDQSGLFQEMVLPRVKDFLEGRNQLMFTYGATSSGKTYTIQVSKIKCLLLLLPFTAVAQLADLRFEDGCILRLFDLLYLS